MYLQYYVVMNQLINKFKLGSLGAATVLTLNQSPVDAAKVNLRKATNTNTQNTPVTLNPKP